MRMPIKGATSIRAICKRKGVTKGFIEVSVERKVKIEYCIIVLFDGAVIRSNISSAKGLSYILELADATAQKVLSFDGLYESYYKKKRGNLG